ncbi:MAG: elongation factor P, partial [Armatimonadota bacterium]
FQFLYTTGDTFIFMDTETYEQRELDREMLGDSVKWLKEGENVQFALYEGKIVDMEVPKAVDREVVQTDPGLRGDTAQGGSKPATIEGGAVVEVPLFVKKGDRIRVDTNSGEYVSRVDA